MKVVHKNKAHLKESGFVLLMGLLILVLGAAAWFGTQGNIRSEGMKQDVQGGYVSTLQLVKERMLTYAILHPELFDSTPPGTPPGSPNIDLDLPGIGYFPCPDISGNQQSETGKECSRSGSLYAMGWVPQKVINRNFSFLPSNLPRENRRYWFAVDARFLVDGEAYRYGSVANRFAPLNIDTPSKVDMNDFRNNCDINPTPTCQFPLTLDGRGDIVMVLFYSGEVVENDTRWVQIVNANSSINRYLEQPSLLVPAEYNFPAEQGAFISHGNGDFFNDETIHMSRSEWDAALLRNGVASFNDEVIAITREEWNAAMLSRVAKDVTSGVSATPGGNGIPDLCESVSSDNAVAGQNSWFNKCLYRGGAPKYSYGGAGCELGDNHLDRNAEGQNWRDALGCPL